MSNLRENPAIVRILRWAAILGVCITALLNIFSAEPLRQNEYFSFYMLAILALAVCIGLFAFLPKAAAAILKNPDLLVPLALYITANGLIGLFGQTAAFTGVKDGRINFEGLTALVLVNWALRIVTVSCFAGWTTRLLLGFVETGKVDLPGSFGDIRHWFPRATAVILFGALPMLVLMPLISLPILMGISHKVYEVVLFLFIALVAVGALFWNLATSALLPYVLKAKIELPKAIREGMFVSWSNKSKVMLPVVLLMVLSGWIVFLMVTYNSYRNDPAEFGRGQTPFSISRTTQFTANFVWTGGYPEESKWHEVLMKTVQAKPLPTIDFRIMLLMLVLSLAVNLQIIATLWGEKETNEYMAIGARAIAHSGIIICAALLLLIPFEYIVLNKSVKKLLKGQGTQEIVVPKVYKGEDKFTRTEIFKYEKSKAERETPMLSVAGAATPDQDELELRDLRQVYVGEVDGEPGKDILAMGETKAFILAPDGRLKGEIDYKLGHYFSESFWQDRRMMSIEIVDFNNDGKPDIAGKGSNTCEIIDLKGRVLWKYPAEKDEDYWSLNSIDVADADNDGRQDVVVGTQTGLELFGKDGKRKWTSKISNFTALKPQVADLDGDGKNEISMGESVVDGNGKLKEKIKLPREVFGLLMEENEPASVLYFNDNKMGLFRSEKPIAKYDAPASDRPEDILPSGNTYVRTAIYRAEAKYVKLGGDKHLAVLADASLERGADVFKILYVYDSEGNLIYHETIRAFFTGAVGALPNEDGSESLLIAAGGRLFRYSLNK